MSFIYDDDKLVLDLLKSAVEFELKFNKRGQVAPNAKINAEYQNYLNLSTKLVEQLKTQYFPQEKDPNAIKSDGQTGPVVADMNTLGNFFDYILKNNITVGNQKIVYAEGENPPNRNWLPVDAEQSKLLVETVDQEGNRKALVGAYHVNKDLLSKYLVKLSAQLNQEKDEETKRFMRSMLAGIMEKVNAVFRTKLTPDHKEVEEELKDNVVLDNVPNPIVSGGADPANPLLVKDVKSVQTLNAWIEDHKMTLKDAKGQVISYTQNYDRCAFINALYTRASTMSDSARPETQKAKAYYVKMMTQIASQANCALKGGGANPNQTAQPQKISAQVMARIFSTLPFMDGAIDFTRITTFLSLVEPLIPATSGSSTEVKGGITEFKTFLKQPNVNQVSIKVNTGQFARLLIEPNSGGKVFGAIEALNQVIDNTRSVLDQFSSAYKSNFGENELRLLGDQIGESQTDDSIYRENANNLANIKGAAVSRPI